MAIVHNSEGLLTEPSTLATVVQSSETSTPATEKSASNPVPNVDGKGDGKGKKTSKYFIPLAA